MVSVIIPIYNAAEHLPDMLRCMEGQTEKDYELLLVNDGSRDNSGDICDEAAKNDSRIRVFHLENGGVSAARNFGMKEAMGDYISFLDADDEIGPEYLSVLLGACLKENSDIAVCDVVVVSGGKKTGRFTNSECVVDPRVAIEFLLIRKKINSGPCGKLFKSELCRTVTFPPLKAYEDILFVKDMFSHANKIAVTDRTEYRYIQNSVGAMTKFIKTPSADIIVATEELIRFINGYAELDPKCMYITMSHLMQYVQSLIGNKDEQGRVFIKKARKLYRRYAGSILKCSAFPLKEKIVFCAFAFGLLYNC